MPPPPCVPSPSTSAVLLVIVVLLISPVPPNWWYPPPVSLDGFRQVELATADAANARMPPPELGDVVLDRRAFQGQEPLVPDAAPQTRAGVTLLDDQPDGGEPACGAHVEYAVEADALDDRGLRAPRG